MEDKRNRKTAVISGINLFEGGPLSIYKDFLQTLMEEGYGDTYHVIAFVHQKSLFAQYQEKLTLIELPKGRKSYLHRLAYEYIYFYLFSKKVKADIWISLHDITPHVKAEKLYTYCHNPSPFLPKDRSIWKYSKTTYLMSCFYRYLYRFNIHKNTAVIVQQDWMREKFREMYGVKNIIVAKPDVRIPETALKRKEGENKKTVFIYASFPRVFKNFEVICRASETLEQDGCEFEVWLTIDGTENNYSKDLRRKYQGVSSIKWLGIKKREEVLELYERSDCMIFPSSLETWGLPVTEYKYTGKPIILADLPYAHETVGTYEKAAFFESKNDGMLGELMKGLIRGEKVYQKVTAKEMKEPCFCGWKGLLKYIFV